MAKKKSNQSPLKISNKHEKRQELSSLIKTMRPKVYITESSNFKTLVQQLTGNGNYSPLSSPPPSTSVTQSPPQYAPGIEEYHAYQENSLHQLLTLDSSSCFSSPSEGSPDFSIPGSYVLGTSTSQTAGQNMDFSSRYKDLESMLMEVDSESYDYDEWYGVFQQEVCHYDYDHYDLSTLI